MTLHLVASREAATNPAGVNYVVARDYAYYLRWEEAGRFHLLTLRASSEGTLVGYLKLSVGGDLHDRHALICDDEGLYVEPMHRSYRNLKLLLDAGEELAKRLGVGVLRLTASASKADGLAKVLTRRGFEPVRVTFGKVL
jgi:GNAT superfamily N-acetyltransferase